MQIKLKRSLGKSLQSIIILLDSLAMLIVSQRPNLRCQKEKPPMTKLYSTEENTKTKASYFS
ncbi:hypothetical protein GIB67_036080 [Kingdonia uniflora]|uniref:Uncharacterized protein n=1 Tax=Kingdonia uniflora TaxID=39325 RepID=A0A7J7N9E4_9MAGN|nr:hypothetical protein GIB67_036080 [Kingdonia uniflora]